MDYTHRAEQANNIPDPTEPATPFNENSIRVGALELVVARQRQTIRAQRDEIERLGHCIEALEREGLEPPERCEHDLPRGCCAICQSERKEAEMPYRGYEGFVAWANAVENSERPHHFERGGIEN